MDLELLFVIIKVLAAVAAGILAGFAVIYIFNKMPAAWLCDYNETPDPVMTDPHVQRIKGYPWRWIYAAGFICLMIRLVFINPQFAAAGIFACWAMVIIGLADLKYMIIPDQFVIMLMLSAMGFVPFNGGIKSMLLGALAGAGIMLAVSVLGGAAYQKQVVGFGDIKLFGAIGLVLGLKGTIFVLITSSITAGIGAAFALARGRAQKNDIKPLGPYICGCGIFYIFIVWPFYM